MLSMFKVFTTIHQSKSWFVFIINFNFHNNLINLILLLFQFLEEEVAVHNDVFLQGHTPSI